jgi:hypothetical protein
MSYALIAMRPADVRQPELSRVLLKHLHDPPNFRIGHAASAKGAIDGREIVVRHCQMLFRTPRMTTFDPQLIEGKKRLAFVDQVEVDVKQLLALRRRNNDVF